MAEQQEKINWADIEDDEEEHQQQQVKEQNVNVVEQVHQQVEGEQETKPQTDEQPIAYKKKPFQKQYKPDWLRIKELQQKQEEEIKLQQEAAMEARRIKPSRNVYKGLEINSDSEGEEGKPKEVTDEKKPEVAVVETVQEEDQYKLLKEKQQQQPEKQQQPKLSKKEQEKKDQEEFDQILKEMGLANKIPEEDNQEVQKKKNKKKKEKKEQPQQQTTQVEEKQSAPVEKVDIKKVIAEKAKKIQSHQSSNVDKDLHNVKQEIEKRNNKSKKNKKHEDL